MSTSKLLSPNPPSVHGVLSGPVTTQSLDNTRKLHSLQFEVEDLSLVVLEGPHQGQKFPLSQDILDLGRQAELCDIVLAQDPSISSLHARIQLRHHPTLPFSVVLQDLGSRNGVYLEGIQVKEAYLTPGLRCKIGNTVMMLQTQTHDKKCLNVPYFDATGQLVGQSESMRRIFAMLNRLAQRDTTVLLTGETGTGKTSIAHTLHRLSHRKHGPWIEVNCGALPPALIESALFGHEKGAFTGATHRHQGYLEQAHDGTLFLDELGELPLDLQPKLLQALETKTIQRLGNSQIVPVNFRLIVATHKNLQREVAEGRFREDLYYRISVVPVHVPPLRERPEDLPLLTERLLVELYPNTPYQISPTAMQLLQQYLWPGNVRQLRNVLERTFIFLDGYTADSHDFDLPAWDQESSSSPPPQFPVVPGTFDLISIPLKLGEPGMTIKELMASFERTVIEKALEHTEGNVVQAAKLLDMAQSWLYKRVKQYNIP